MQETNKIYIDGLITEAERTNIEHYEATKLFSIHWEIRTLLYLGVLLFTSGIGLLVYININTIGHQAIIAAIGLACAGCLYYAFVHKQPYLNSEVKNTSTLFDYIALLGCLLFGTFIGYLQFQYRIFGNAIWAATSLPAVLFMYGAYAFDNKGLLSLGITALASTIGLSVTPLYLMDSSTFFSTRILLTSFVFGIALVAFAWYSHQKNIKPHFSFSYHSFACTLLFVACLTALFEHPLKALSFVVLLGCCYYFVQYAISQQSFMFLLLATVYTYIGFTYFIFEVLVRTLFEIILPVFGSFYSFASCGGIIYFFMNYKKILRIK